MVKGLHSAMCIKQPWTQALLLCSLFLLESAGTKQQHPTGHALGFRTQTTTNNSVIKISQGEGAATLASRKIKFFESHHHVSGSRSHPRALVSLLLDNAQHQYIQGAHVLAKSVLYHAPDYFNARVLLLIKGRNYTDEVVQQARVAGWTLEWVDPIRPPQVASSLTSTDQFAKLHLWNLERFKQVVYMDLDVALVAPLTAHFVSQHDYPTQCMLWAARDIKDGVWQDSFNMGVAGLVPNRTEYLRLLDLLMNDKNRYKDARLFQRFLNNVYTQANGQWCELEFELAANLAVYSGAQSFWLSTTPQVVHYTASKPWNCSLEYRPICKVWDEHLHSDVHPVTVVSAYYSGPNKHGSSKYAEWGKNFLAHKMPLIIYTDDPAGVPGLNERDPKLTKIVVQNSSAFSVSHKLFDWEKQLSVDPEKSIHSTHLLKVWLEKTNWVLTACKSNPFHSQHFVWVDFGSFRSGFWNDTWVALAERFPHHEQRMLLLRSPGDQSFSPKRVGGMFGGSKTAWKLWSSVFYTVVRRRYREGVFIGDDQIPMTNVALQHPKLVCILEPQSIDGSDPWFFLLWYLAGKAPTQECSAL